MSTAEVIEGTVKSDGSLDLDQKPTVGPGRVRVMLEPVAGGPAKGGLAEVLEQIAQEQQARGFVGQSAEEIEAGLHDDDEYERTMDSLYSGSHDFAEDILP